MAELKQNATMFRGEQAFYKEKKLKKTIDSPHYKVENGDIYLLTGQYSNCWVIDLWGKGSNERDYIIKHLYVLKDLEIQRIIKGLFCQ